MSEIFEETDKTARLNQWERDTLYALLKFILAGEFKKANYIPFVKMYNIDSFKEIFYSYGKTEFTLCEKSKLDEYIFIIKDNGDLIYEIYIPSIDDKNFGITITFDIIRSRFPEQIIGITGYW